MYKGPEAQTPGPVWLDPREQGEEGYEMRLLRGTGQ